MYLPEYNKGSYCHQKNVQQPVLRAIAWLRGCHGQGVQRRSQGFPHQFQPMEKVDSGQHVGRIRPLHPPGFQPAFLLKKGQQRF